MLDQLTPPCSVLCSWCEQPTNPTYMQVIDIHDGPDPDLITDAAMVCAGCLETIEGK